LVSRMPLRRLDAEALHDTMLLIAGRLDETRYGPPDPVEVRDDGLIFPIWSEKGGRRSVYVKQRRTELPTLLVNFDLPAMAPNCLNRENSTVALQALTLMNDGRVHEIAASLAERVKKEAGTDPVKQIDAVFWMALSRPPNEV